MSIFDHCHANNGASFVGRQIPVGVTIEEAERKSKELDVLALLAHAVACPGCRIRVRRVEASDVPDLRGGVDPSTLYMDKPGSWVLCDEGKKRLEATK